MAVCVHMHMYMFLKSRETREAFIRVDALAAPICLSPPSVHPVILSSETCIAAGLMPLATRNQLTLRRNEPWGQSQYQRMGKHYSYSTLSTSTLAKLHQWSPGQALHPWRSRRRPAHTNGARQPSFQAALLPSEGSTTPVQRRGRKRLSLEESAWHHHPRLEKLLVDQERLLLKVAINHHGPPVFARP